MQMGTAAGHRLSRAIEGESGAVPWTASEMIRLRISARRAEMLLCKSTAGGPDLMTWFALSRLNTQWLLQLSSNSSGQMDD